MSILYIWATRREFPTARNLWRRSNATRLKIPQFLASVGIKILVVACNTASALALPKIRERIGIDVVGVIGPGARKAVEITKEKTNPKIGVIATEATVASRAYAEAIMRTARRAEVIRNGMSAVCRARRRKLDERAGNLFDRRKISGKNRRETS